MGKIPKIKKKVSAFLIGEEGRISKKKVLKAGTALLLGTMGALANSGEVSAGHTSNYCSDHTNQLSLDYDDWTLEGSHNNVNLHSSHCSCTWCCYW